MSKSKPGPSKKPKKKQRKPLSIQIEQRDPQELFIR